MDAELVILGSGTSAGVPLIGCECEVCLSPNPKNKRLRTSALIRTSNGPTILLDASTDLRAQLLRESVQSLDGIFYTHPHADHILGTDDLRIFHLHSPGRAGLPCFLNEITLASLKRSFSYIFEPDPGYLGGPLAKLEPTLISPYDPFIFQGVRVTPFPLIHGNMEVLGYRIGNLAYATDCKVIPERAQEIITGVDHLILDGLRYRDHPTHFTIPEAVEMAKKLKAKQTYLIHLTHDTDHEQLNDDLPDGIQAAFDGMRISFKAA